VSLSLCDTSFPEAVWQENYQASTGPDPGTSLSLLHRVPGAVDQQGSDSRSPHGGYDACTGATNAVNDKTSGARSSDQPSRTLIGKEPSDPEKLEEVARFEEKPGPECLGLPVHKLLRGANNGDYEKLDPSKCDVSIPYAKADDVKVFVFIGTDQVGRTSKGVPYFACYGQNLRVIEQSLTLLLRLLLGFPTRRFL
jgi:hypothetical protein